MSGGSLNYVCQKVERAVETGHLDEEKIELVKDIAGLLHDIEWSASGDYGPDQFRSTLAEFTTKWEGGYRHSEKPTSEQKQCAACSNEIGEDEYYIELPLMRNGESDGEARVHQACFLLNMENHV
ncbi:hypothetical protein [Halomarina rubra]|uniref:HD domain-containing protein n=1 Tax=Halomarina rubra TaxID=2071873 RepID=A0ABD6B0X7_9EURY|nr:hypothetical protein [Halomarina rubra]